MPQTSTTTLPVVVDGSVKRTFIDGRHAAAVSGKTVRTINPSSGEVLAAAATR
jgi:aldehyde dehydrogenase (NAD+)